MKIRPHRLITGVLLISLPLAAIAIVLHIHTNVTALNYYHIIGGIVVGSIVVFSGAILIVEGFAAIVKVRRYNRKKW